MELFQCSIFNGRIRNETGWGFDYDARLGYVLSILKPDGSTVWVEKVRVENPKVFQHVGGKYQSSKHRLSFEGFFKFKKELNHWVLDVDTDQSNADYISVNIVTDGFISFGSKDTKNQRTEIKHKPQRVIYDNNNFAFANIKLAKNEVVSIICKPNKHNKKPFELQQKIFILYYDRRSKTCKIKDITLKSKIGQKWFTKFYIFIVKFLNSF